MARRDIYSIMESQFFTIEGSSPREGACPISENNFEKLENFILENPISALAGQPNYLLEPMGEGKERILMAKGFAGVIVMKNGTEYEILPSLSLVSENGERIHEKKFFLQMLKANPSLPLGNYNIDNPTALKYNLFDTFAQSIVNDCFMILNDGLKQCYTPFENNENFLKGKVVYAKHATKNFAHKDKFYVVYDIFTINRPENKLLKAILQYVKKTSCSASIKGKIEVILANFDNVDDSISYTQDYAAAVHDRSMRLYTGPLKWGEMFLLKKGGISMANGRDVRYSYMLPVEQLFDCYIASMLNKVIDKSNYTVDVQKKIYPVLNKKAPNTDQKPGMFLIRKADKSRAIIDAKWQALDPDEENYGIKDVDLYNAYNMQEIYNAETVYYLYPITDKIRGMEPDIVFRDENRILGRVCFIDISDIEQSLINVLMQIYNDEIGETA